MKRSLCSLHLKLRFLIFLAAGTGFMEDGFFADGGGEWGDGFRMIQVPYVHGASLRL